MSPCGHQLLVLCIISSLAVFSGSHGTRVEGSAPLGAAFKGEKLESRVRRPYRVIQKVIRVRRQAQADYDVYFVCHDKTPDIRHCRKIIANATTTKNLPNTITPIYKSPTTKLSTYYTKTTAGLPTKSLIPSRPATWPTTVVSWQGSSFKTGSTNRVKTGTPTLGPIFGSTTRPTRPTLPKTTIPWWYPGTPPASPTPPAGQQSILLYIIPSAFGCLILILAITVCCCIYIRRRPREQNDSGSTKNTKPASRKLPAPDVIRKVHLDGDTLKVSGSTKKAPLGGSTKKAPPKEETSVDVPLEKGGVRRAMMPPGYMTVDDKDAYGDIMVIDRSLPMITSLTLQNECDRDPAPNSTSTDSVKTHTSSKTKVGKQRSQSEKEKKEPAKNKPQQTSGKSRSSSTNRSEIKKGSKSSSRGNDGKRKQ